ncbi:MAG TPA: Amuc_1100 family pilus-like protein [Verrucomicrobiota bacterium]|nr:Amuc_1100 family pilus-like protein [Verrucomicrobiota bacterium]
MSWIKRNLYSVIGAAVAVVLLALAGTYLFSKWKLNNRNREELEAAYADWGRIMTRTPTPGNNKTNNIGNARNHEASVRKTIDVMKRYFVPVPPIPNPEEGPVTRDEFLSALRRTINQLHKEAENLGVTVPARYSFSFEAQKDLFNPAPRSLGPLSQQLGDIRAICTILFRAKVNSLDNIRRERVSTDDYRGPVQDYLEATVTAQTNDLAVLVPYEVTFQSFSGELAEVLAGFQSSPHGFIVKSVNVMPASQAPAMGMDGMMAGPGGLGGPERYERYTPVPGYYPQPVPQPQPARGGLQTVLDEEQLRITLIVNVVRLLPRN